jgi:hypothetical protein
MHFSSGACWRTGFCASSATSAAKSEFWHSAAKAAASTAGMLPCALRASLRLFNLAPGDVVPILRRVA